MKKIVLVHDYFDIPTGSEKCVDIFYNLFDKPPVYTLFDKLKRYDNVHTTFLQKSEMMKKYYNKLIFLFPFAVKTIKIDNADIILSSSHAWVKNIHKPKDAIHICYCHTPMRFAWDLREEYIKEEPPFLRPFIRTFLWQLRKWDYKNTKNVDYFIANSQNVKGRIKRWYNRDAEVIYPPVETEFFKPSSEQKYFYLIVSRLIKQKNIETAIHAFNKLGYQLKIIGQGREQKYFEKIANANISFLGGVDQSTLRQHYQQCKAVIFPSEDDFGIVPVEAQACGKPVIALGKGGALESVKEGETGLFYKNNDPEDIIKAIKKLNTLKINPKVCRKNALRFDKGIFEQKIKKFVTRFA